MKHLRALNKYFWKYRIRLGIGIAFVFLSNYFNVLAPQVTSFVIGFVQQKLKGGNNHTPPVQSHYATLVNKITAWLMDPAYSIFTVVALIGIIILALALLRGFFLFLMRQTIIVMSRHIEYDQKNEIYRHYQRLDTAFYKTHSTGDMMNRIAEDVSRVRMFVGPAVMYIANLLAVISLSIYFMLKTDVELTLYVLMPLPVLAATIYYVNNTIQRKSERIQARLSSLTMQAQESYSGIRVIKSYVQEKAMLGFFRHGSEAYKKNAIGLAKVEAVFFPSITFLIGLSTLLTIMIGGLYYIRGQHHIGLNTIVEFVMYINMLTFPVSAIGLTASMIQRASASQKRINEFLKTEPSISNPVSAETAVLKGQIRFQDVNFTYPHTGIKALKNFNLEIEAGEKVAIVGRTGSGKSTIAQLLLRMYDPDSGQIFLDGHAIRQLELRSLRKQISYVPQDIFLFSDSIENNILFGVDKNKDHMPAREAAVTAVIDREISAFPEQYDTIVGERGVTLSGGQKQRVSIARAFMKPSSVVLFDDCLSAVDARTENEIIRNMQETLSGKTTIIITHRIFTLFHFDKIIVLDDGQIIEQGDHASLLEKKGYYARLFERQQKGDSAMSFATE